MRKEQHCSLCQGKLVREEDVVIQVNALSYTLAWVCTECSAAFPIATGKGGIIRRASPLYEDGKKLQ